VVLSRYCLDTSAYSHFKRGDARVVELLERAEWIGVPCVVLGELYAGFRAGSRRLQNEAELDEFLSEPVVEQLPVDSHVAMIFGDMVAELRRSGTPMPSNDIWIAATCARAGATLLSFDKHFLNFPRVGAIVF
jgi:tRNA(fMet)-specific endonuclease VapC